jgi:hypothetical protein
MPRRIHLKRMMPWSMLAAVSVVAASLVIIAQPAAPALAATNQFKGVNWADTRDNYNTGWVIPDGLSSSDTYSQVYTVANDTIEAFESDLGANTVRLPINIPSVSQSWWSSYRAATDAALADGMKVILGRIGSYTGRTIIDEFGAPMTTGTDYLTNHNDGLNQAYLAAVTDTARADSMGSVYWAGLKGGDSYSMTERSGTGLTVNNESGLKQVQWGWGD